MDSRRPGRRLAAQGFWPVNPSTYSKNRVWIDRPPSPKSPSQVNDFRIDYETQHHAQ